MEINQGDGFIILQSLNTIKIWIIYYFWIILRPLISILRHFYDNSCRRSVGSPVTL